MNVRITRSTVPGRTVLYPGVDGVHCDGKDYAGSGAHRWLTLADSQGDETHVPIGGRHGSIEIALDDEGAVT